MIPHPILTIPEKTSNSEDPDYVIFTTLQFFILADEVIAFDDPKLSTVPDT